MTVSGTHRFDQIGVASQVQFGKNGTWLASGHFGDSAGAFLALSADGQSLARIQIADPQTAIDALTLGIYQGGMADVAAQLSGKVSLDAYQGDLANIAAQLGNSVSTVALQAGLTSVQASVAAQLANTVSTSAYNAGQANVVGQINTVSGYVANLANAFSANTAVSTMNAATVVFTGGTMDGVTIGSSTPAAASFSTITVASAQMDGGSY